MEIKLGRFQNISNYEYHNLMPYAYSNSDLVSFIDSPSNLIQKRNGPRKETAALNFGQALHARLEHHENQDDYLKLVAVPPSVDRRTKEGKDLHAKFELESVDKIVLKPDEWDTLENMLEGMRCHPDGNRVLNAKGFREETFVWIDKDTGVICKCRPDKWIAESQFGLPEYLVTDWKSIDNIKKSLEREIQSVIFERKYYMQAALMVDGMKEVLNKEIDFFFTFMEKTGKYRTYLAVPDKAMIEKGRELYKRQLEGIAECQKKDLWTGFKDISLPAYALVEI